MTVEALRFRPDCLELLDQRLLPADVAYVRCHDAAAVAEAITAMVVRGAPAIACAAAFGVALEARRQEQGDLDVALPRAFDGLAASRPTAINLFWALDRMRAAWQAVRRETPPRIASHLMDEAQRIFAQDLAVNLAIGDHGAPLMRDGARVLTHCNAGALATAGHGTALGIVRSAVRAGRTISVIADETRPFLQGARLTAWEMLAEGIAVTVITDGMSGFLMSRSEVDAVIVGADRVAANGDVANKIGTYMVAVLAARHRIPFYVACPLSTIDRNCPDGGRIPIEERPAREVTGFGTAVWTPPGVAVRNPAFDVTPAELVTALVTERGVIPSPSPASIAALFDRA